MHQQTAQFGSGLTIAATQNIVLESLVWKMRLQLTRAAQLVLWAPLVQAAHITITGGCAVHADRLFDWFKRTSVHHTWQKRIPRLALGIFRSIY
jgi:hypothetical protein